MMGWKDQTSKEIATCENFVSPWICCEEAAAGMLRAFPVHFVPLQSNSTHCNVHGSRTAPENWVKCDISFKHTFGQIIELWWIGISDQPGICVDHLYTQKLHVNPVWEPHVTPNSFTFYTKFLAQNDQNSTRKFLHVSYTELSDMWHFIETQFWANYCELAHFKQINLKSVYI